MSSTDTAERMGADGGKDGGKAPGIDGREDAGHSFLPRRRLAWAQLVMGWICAQALLTLIPIAPPGWGAPALALAGGGFALWALVGLRRALTARPMLSIDAAGIALAGALGTRRVAWAEVMHWRVVPEERRLAIALAGGRRRRLAQGAGLALDTRHVDARLTDIVRAFRDMRPDLERGP